MKVKELIELLKAIDQNIDVFINGNEVMDVVLQPVKTTVGYFGKQYQVFDTSRKFAVTFGRLSESSDGTVDTTIYW